MQQPKKERRETCYAVVADRPGILKRWESKDTFQSHLGWLGPGAVKSGISLEVAQAALAAACAWHVSCGSRHPCLALEKPVVSTGAPPLISNKAAGVRDVSQLIDALATGLSTSPLLRRRLGTTTSPFVIASLFLCRAAAFNASGAAGIFQTS